MDDILKQNIFKTLGLDRLPLAKQEEALLGISKIIFQAVLIRVFEELNEEDKDELEALLVRKPDDETAMLAFFRGKLPNLDDIVDEEIRKFKAESVDLIKNAS